MHVGREGGTETCQQANKSQSYRSKKSKSQLSFIKAGGTILGESQGEK